MWTDLLSTEIRADSKDGRQEASVDVVFLVKEDQKLFHFQGLWSKT